MNTVAGDAVQPLAVALSDDDMSGTNDLPLRLGWIPLLAMLTGCVVQVTHPSRTREEQARDIVICDDQGYYASPHDPLLAYQLATDCLEAKGYTRRKRK
jgi:hypothetical protein